MIHHGPMLDRVCGWLHTRAVIKIGPARIFHMGLLTEHAGPGAVLSLSFLGGAGYIPNPETRDTCWLRGFTVYLRVRPSRRGRTYTAGRLTFPRLVVTLNPNLYTVPNSY